MCSKLDSSHRGGRLPSRSDLVPLPDDTGSGRGSRVQARSRIPETFAGRPPDRVFQKQNNTFDCRHHVRIWRLPQMVEGRPVWAASATHDVGIKFTRSERTFTHRVETDIDFERQKIVDDLRFAGFVQGFALAIRPTVPTRMVNATDDEMTTDGRIAVIGPGRP